MELKLSLEHNVNFNRCSFFLQCDSMANKTFQPHNKSKKNEKEIELKFECKRMRDMKNVKK